MKSAGNSFKFFSRFQRDNGIEHKAWSPIQTSNQRHRECARFFSILRECEIIDKMAMYIINLCPRSLFELCDAAKH